MQILTILLVGLMLLTRTRCLENLKKPDNIVSIKEGVGLGGIWRTKTQWKAHWVKHWEVKKIYVPIWQKVWAPTEVKEWLPLPQMPLMEEHNWESEQPR